MGILLAGIAGIVMILLLVFNYFFFNINRLPEGEFLTEEISPNGDYTIKIYVSDGGATVSDAVRGEVIYHKRKDKKKNIYWQNHEESAMIYWINEHTISINEMELDVRKDIYDFRKY